MICAEIGQTRIDRITQCLMDGNCLDFILNATGDPKGLPSFPLAMLLRRSLSCLAVKILSRKKLQLRIEDTHRVCVLFYLIGCRSLVGAGSISCTWFARET